MAEYEWAQITLGKNAEIQKIATAAAKALGFAFKKESKVLALLLPPTLFS